MDDLVKRLRSGFTVPVKETAVEIERLIAQEAWALDLCVLLDQIDLASPEEVPGLCRQRFAIAEKHGMTVTFVGPTSGAEH